MGPLLGRPGAQRAAAPVPRRSVDARRRIAGDGAAPPVDPSTLDGEAREDAERAWNQFWAARSPALAEYLAELRAIEGADVVGEVEAAKKSLIRQKRSANNKLQEKWGAPTPPWDDRLLANVIWNIHNTPASNISMVGRITGFTFAPVGACATFGVTLRLAMNAIRLGQAKAVVIGAADPPPHPLLVGAFYNGRVISADGEVSRPLTGLRGTHVSGGAAIWIVGDLEHMTARGFRPLGLEPIAVGVSADAEHIITPSEDGPLQAIREAIAGAGVEPGEIAAWDLHATATPGDWQEVANLRRVLPESVLVTARKGIFGHGMGAAGGWELTAQYLGLARGRIFPTPLPERDSTPRSRSSITASSSIAPARRRPGSWASCRWAWAASTPACCRDRGPSAAPRRDAAPLRDGRRIASCDPRPTPPPASRAPPGRRRRAV